MPRTIRKSKLHSSKQKLKFKPELNKTQSNIPPNFESFKQKLLSGNGFLKSKEFL